MLATLGARVSLLPQEAIYLLLSGLPGVTQCLSNLKGRRLLGRGGRLEGHCRAPAPINPTSGIKGPTGMYS